MFPRMGDGNEVAMKTLEASNLSSTKEVWLSERR